MRNGPVPGEEGRFGAPSPGTAASSAVMKSGQSTDEERTAFQRLGRLDPGSSRWHRPRGRGPDRLHTDRQREWTIDKRELSRSCPGSIGLGPSARSRGAVHRTACIERATKWTIDSERRRVAKTKQTEGNRAGTAGCRPFAPFTAD